jgi:hypothetical protein
MATNILVETVPQRKALKARDMPVMAAKCSTCPFKGNGNIELRNRIMQRMFKTSQICHAPALKGKKQTHLCRGARDEQLTVLFRLGFLTEPTDQAFKETSDRILKG